MHIRILQPKPGDRPVPVDGTTPESTATRPIVKEEIKEENNQSQNNANSAVAGPSVPGVAAGVSVPGGGGGGGGGGVGASGAGGGGGGSGAGTFFTSTGPSNMKPSMAKKRKIMGK